MAAGEVRQDALEGLAVAPAVPVSRRRTNSISLPSPIRLQEDLSSGLRRQSSAKGVSRSKPYVAGHRVQGLDEELRSSSSPRGLTAPSLGESDSSSGTTRSGIEIHARSQAAAVVAGTVGAVEGEGAGGDLGVAYARRSGAGELGREDVILPCRAPPRRPGPRRSRGPSPGSRRGGSRYPFPRDEPVHHHLDGVFLLLVELDLLRQVADGRRRHADPDEALLARRRRRPSDTFPLAAAAPGAPGCGCALPA